MRGKKLSGLRAGRLVIDLELVSLWLIGYTAIKLAV